LTAAWQHPDMPRHARAVFAGLPRHVAHRGNRRQDVFFGDDDRRVYLAWLREYCEAGASRCSPIA